MGFSGAVVGKMMRRAGNVRASLTWTGASRFIRVVGIGQSARLYVYYPVCGVHLLTYR